MKKDFILASGSVHRKQLLLSAGFEPKQIITADIDEIPKANENPKDYVKRMAFEKALAVYQKHTGNIILAADTIVLCQDKIIQKSKSDNQQREVMHLLSGSKHSVLTAVCLIDENGNIFQDLSETGVSIKPLSDEEIEQYIQTKHWVGCCGYNNDGMMESFTEGYYGSYSGLVGLPLCIVRSLFKKIDAI